MLLHDLQPCYVRPTCMVAIFFFSFQLLACFAAFDEDFSFGVHVLLGW